MAALLASAFFFCTRFALQLSRYFVAAWTSSRGSCDCLSDCIMSRT